MHLPSQAPRKEKQHWQLVIDEALHTSQTERHDSGGLHGPTPRDVLMSEASWEPLAEGEETL